MFIKKPKHRKFDYQPRYYDPNKDKDERRKRKLGFRSTKIKATKKRSPLIFIVMLIIIVYFILKFQGLL